MADSVPQARALEQLPSGVAGLDTILHGGFLQGGIYILMGNPGTGKTILANQICFNHVANGGQAMYVTLLAETHARMLAHLRSLAFFDPEPISTALYYISGYQVLQQGGLHGLLEFLRGVIRDQRTSLLVIDGLAMTEESAESDTNYKRFIHELQVYTEATNCTTLLLTQQNSGRSFHPEHTMVDGLVVLTDQRVGLRSMREIEVRKLRGSDYLRGAHFFDISNAGIVVYPRLEVALNSQPASVVHLEPRLAFGIRALDSMLRGGLAPGSTTMLLGAPGSGKTLLGLHFLAEGARAGQPGLHFGFYETPVRLRAKAAAAGVIIDPDGAGSPVEIVWQPAVEGILDALADRLLREVRRRNVQRLFIDGLAGFQDVAAYADRAGRVLVALFNELRALGITTVFSTELPSLFSSEVQVPTNGVSAIVENMVFLRYVALHSQLYRLLSIIKVRDSEYDSSVHEFTITAQGIDVAATADSADAILRGAGRPPSAIFDQAPPNTPPVAP